MPSQASVQLLVYGPSDCVTDSRVSRMHKSPVPFLVQSSAGDFMTFLNASYCFSRSQIMSLLIRLDRKQMVIPFPEWEREDDFDSRTLSSSLICGRMNTGESTRNTQNCDRLQFYFVSRDSGSVSTSLSKKFVKTSGERNASLNQFRRSQECR